MKVTPTGVFSWQIWIANDDVVRRIKRTCWSWRISCWLNSRETRWSFLRIHLLVPPFSNNLRIDICLVVRIFRGQRHVFDCRLPWNKFVQIGIVLLYSAKAQITHCIIGPNRLEDTRRVRKTTFPRDCKLLIYLSSRAIGQSHYTISKI